MYCDILIVGGDGDLALRKLYPALYHLDVAGLLPSCLRVVSLARTVRSPELFGERIRQRLEHSLAPEAVDPDVWQRFATRLHHEPVDATEVADMRPLSAELFADPERDLIVYLATPPSIFAPVCENLEAVNLVRPNTRIVVEKPLGHSRESFLEINRRLTAIFREEQVYRIDHYLGKESVQNLLALRFANSLLEPLWNNKYIDHIQITVAESVGVEGRWDFYDETGALRDMMQNHLLQLACLAAMEPPARLDAACVHDEKLKVLRCLRSMDSARVARDTVRGQYTSGAVGGELVAGYLQEEGAEAASETETFVAIKAEIDNWRWARVPFYLRTGKRLQKRYSEIVIQFREVPHSIFPGQNVFNHPNKLVIRLQPEEGVYLELLNKAPGLDVSMPLEPVRLDLSFSEAFTDTRVPDAYERLLYDVLRDNMTLFMRADELEAAWCWVDDIIQGWRTTRQPAVPYSAGSWGPGESIALIARDNRSWH